MPGRLTRAAVVLATLAAPLQAAQPQFWKLEGAKDFLEGDLAGLSVDSRGHLRLGPAATLLHDTEAAFVWSLAHDGKGRVYAGTGNEGKVYRIEDGKGSLLYDAPEMAVQALAVGPDQRLYAGTSPDGKVYAIDKDGKAEVFYDPGDKYIWALAFDREGRLFVATGAEGKVYRVDRKGKGEVVFASPEANITSLAVDEKGNCYAGSSPSGIVYRIDPSLKVFVLLDSPYREIKALAVGADGTLYAAAVDGKEEPKPAGAAPAPLAPLTAATEVTVTESFTVVPPAPAPQPPPLAPGIPPAPQRPGGNKGALVRIRPSGEIETLWSSPEEIPQALIVTAEGVLLGTGNKGKLYRIRDDRAWAMVGALPGEQVTGLVQSPKGDVVLATSNPGKVYALSAAPGAAGTFTSRVKDTDTVSSWGRLRWDAQVPPGTELEIQSRSGNSGSPDTTWTDWSARYERAEGQAVTSEKSRFIQVRAVFRGKDGSSPVLDALSLAYLQRNLRPQVLSISVHAPGEVFQKPISVTGEPELLGFEPGEAPELRPGGASLRPQMPPAISYARRMYQRGIQTFSWKAEDPNGDSLVYDVHYRAVGETRWRLLRKGLTESVLAWDTSTVPNGRYVVRVTAVDSPSNPEALALAGEKESAPFDVDNTPPVVTATIDQRAPIRISVRVKDDNSLIRKTEYSVDGGRWQEVHPVDGINDAPEETYQFTLAEVPGPGPHLVVVRAMDLLGNVATARVEVP